MKHRDIPIRSATNKWIKGFSASFALCLIFVAACTHETVMPGSVNTNNDPQEMPCDPEVVYFENEILPILRSNCAKSGCHDAASHQDNIILDSYENVMASDIIKLFDSEDSDLFEVITETDPDKVMPEPPNQRLSAEQIVRIGRWIDQGAKALSCNDPNQPCLTDNISYSGFVAPLLATNCVGCHSGGTPSGNIVLNSHSAVQTLALNGRLLGAITWANGYQPMPQGSGKLTACTIDKINAWINDGAPDN